MNKDHQHVVLFSGGIGSWGAAKKLVNQIGTKNVHLLFTDTLIEDEDLYRFINDAAQNIGVPLTTIADGRTPWQVFQDERFLGNTRADPCSKILKRKLARKWIDQLAEKSPKGVTVYIGIDWTEEPRYLKAKKFWQPHEIGRAHV